MIGKKVRTPKVTNFEACNSSMEEQDKLHEILIQESSSAIKMVQVVKEELYKILIYIILWHLILIHASPFIAILL